MSELRQRSTKKDEDEDKGNKLTASQLARAEDCSFSLVEIARSIVFLLLLSGATSYFVTRESFAWNLSRPKWTQPEVIQAWLVRLYLSSIASLYVCEISDPNLIRSPERP
jgi:hypothetical protein